VATTTTNITATSTIAVCNTELTGWTVLAETTVGVAQGPRRRLHGLDSDSLPGLHRVDRPYLRLRALGLSGCTPVSRPQPRKGLPEHPCGAGTGHVATFAVVQVFVRVIVAHNRIGTKCRGRTPWWYSLCQYLACLPAGEGGRGHRRRLGRTAHARDRCRHPRGRLRGGGLRAPGPRQADGQRPAGLPQRVEG
jgi:hypothetical protein